VENGQGTLGVLRDSLNKADAQVFIRLAVDAERGAVRCLDAVVAPPTEPPGWKPMVWEYTAGTFIAGQTSSRALAAALDPDDAQVLPVGGFELTLPVLSDQFTRQHKPSRARYDSVVLPWPSIIFELQTPGGPGAWQRPLGYMIGDDCPSFSSYDAAFRAFFYGDFSRLSHGQVPSGFGPARLTDNRAWLEKIKITPASLEVRLGGDSFDGVRVELNSDTYQADARATESGRVTLPLPDGLPGGAWLYLSRDRQWLDYRAIGDYSGIAELAHAGVDVEVPEDPESVIGALIAGGEGAATEFKSQLPEDTDDSKRTVLKTVVAFANGHGGSIVFGIASDEATVCGVDDASLIAARDRLGHLVATRITPVPVIEVNPHEVEGKKVLVMSVERGNSPPYALLHKGRTEYFVRRDATTFPARPEDIRSFVLASAPAPAHTGPWGS
jgi:hypothetical protein